MKKILLIEDNDTIRENTAEILELANYNVVTAPNGKIGVEETMKNRPDLIICDIMMPVLDGYGVLHMLHKNKETEDTPFIFLSAKSERADMRKGMEIGADDYITKPFIATELLTAIESRLQRAAIMKKEAAASALQAVNGAHHEMNTNEMMTEFIGNRNKNLFKKKQVIYSEGNRPAALYYVLKGNVKSFKINDEGKELVIELFGPGDFIGYTALLDGSNYRDTAAAMSECELAVIPAKDFEELVNGQWDIARKFIKMMAKQVAEQEEHLIGLAYNSLRKKVAAALVRMQEKFSPEKKYCFDISRENLASIAGTATESLIRTLSDFREEKLIDIREGQIVILNQKKLSEMFN